MAARQDTTGPPEGKAQLNPEFEKEFDEWLVNTTKEERLKDGSRFLVGRTSEKLRKADVDEYDIYFGKSKIAKIMQNPEMTADVIKGAVRVVEDPVVVMDSRTVPGSITMFGDAKTANEKPVMVSMLLHPENQTGEIMDYGVVTSAYGRRKSNAQNLINNSAIRYVDENEKRTAEWSKALGLQLPSALSTQDPNGILPQPEDTVNSEERGNASVTVAADMDDADAENYGEIDSSICVPRCLHHTAPPITDLT